MMYVLPIQSTEFINQAPLPPKANNNKIACERFQLGMSLVIETKPSNEYFAIR